MLICCLDLYIIAKFFLMLRKSYVIKELTEIEEEMKSSLSYLSKESEDSVGYK